jgi:hypothetical protein
MCGEIRGGQPTVSSADHVYRSRATQRRNTTGRPKISAAHHDIRPSSMNCNGRAPRRSEGSPDVVQLRPNSRQNGVAGLTGDQHETTRFTTLLNLQNLDPRFKSGRLLRNFLGVHSGHMGNTAPL